jgi:hypothetical protein
LRTPSPNTLSARPQALDLQGYVRLVLRPAGSLRHMTPTTNHCPLMESTQRSSASLLYHGIVPAPLRLF